MLLRPFLLPQLSGDFADDKAVLSSFAKPSAELVFLSLLGDAARADSLKSATHDLAQALLHAAGFQSDLLIVR